MPEPLLYLKASGAAAIVSAVFMLTMTAVRRTPGVAWIHSTCVVAIGLGLAVGYYVLSLSVASPPMNGLDRLLVIVVPAVLGIELIAGLQSVPPWVAWSLRIGLAASMPRILLHGSVYLSGDSESTVWLAGAILVGCGALLAALWSLLSWLSRRSPGVSIPIALSLTIQCAGLTVMMAGYIKGGAAAFPIVATLLAVAIAARLVTKRFAVASVDAPAIGIGVVGLFGLLFIGRFFGELSTSCTLVLLLAPLLCWATETPFLRDRKPWLVGSLRVVLVAIPLVVVLVVAKREFDRTMLPLLGNAMTPTTNVVHHKTDFAIIAWYSRNTLRSSSMPNT
jgi:hypothetical protein